MTYPPTIFAALAAIAVLIGIVLTTMAAGSGRKRDGRAGSFKVYALLAFVVAAFFIFMVFAAMEIQVIQ